MIHTGTMRFPERSSAPHPLDCAARRLVPWPTISRLEAWSTVGRESAEVAFVGRAATERGMWSTLIVPLGHTGDFTAERLTAERNMGQQPEESFGCGDQPLNDGNAPILVDGPETRLDAASLAPRLELGTPELPAFVGDQVSRCGNANGSQEHQNPSSVGTAVKSTIQR